VLIDWFTVVAQLVNFAILLVVLKFLLYDRIVQAMEERRRAIAEREGQAEQRRREADEKATQLDEERRELADRRRDLLDEARRHAEERRAELLEEARERVAEQEKQWKESVRTERIDLLTELQRATGEHARAIARRLLRDLADADLEERLVHGLLDRVDAIPEEERREFVDAVHSQDQPLVVSTAFEIGSDQRRRLAERLRELAGDPDREIQWERDPELVAGAVISGGGRQITWTVDGYLAGLREEFEDRLAAGRMEGAPANETERPSSEGSDRVS